jgi:putative spermidine/putrescine transport system substrate-binding protein
MKRMCGSIAAALILSASLVTLAWSQGAVELKVANYGGAFTGTQNKYAAELFTKRTGIKIRWIDGNPSDHLAKMLASRGREVPFDVVYLDDNVHADAVKSGLVMKLDPGIVTNLKHIYQEAKDKDGYGPGMVLISLGLVYNTKKFTELGLPEPTSWNDLWNPKLAGHVAVPDITNTNGILFLIAAALINGGNEKQIDKGFQKLAQLKPLYFWNSTADLRTKFISGDAWASFLNNGRSWGMIEEGVPLKFVIPKEGGFRSVTTIDVVSGTKYPKEAQQFLNFVLDPLVQLGQANEIGYGPTNSLLVSVLQQYPELTRKFPATPDAMKGLYAPDWTYVNANYQAWVERWNREIVK